MSPVLSTTLPAANQLAVVRDSADLLPHEAFERAQPAARALSATELIPLNVDLPRAVTVAAGALPKIMALRERALKELPTIDARDFDELHTYVFAAAHAHARFMGTSRSEQDVKALNARVVSSYGALYLDALALSRRGLLAAEGVRKLKHRVGYLHSGFELLALIQLFRQSWNSIESKTALTLQELDQAEALAEQLLDAVAAREHVDRRLAEAAEQRLRHFTLFVNAYDQVRRAIAFLRWTEGDAELIAPSLYGGRKRRHAPETHAVAPAGTKLAE